MKLSTTKTKAEQFIDLVMQGMECWIQAGELVAAAIDENPNFVDEVCDKCADISPEMVHRFEAIGRRRLHPQLLLADGPGIRRLRNLPYSLQEKHSKEPVNVILEDGKSLLVDVRNLLPEQASQVFAHDRIRSDGEQRAWLEDRKATKVVEPSKRNQPYRVVSNKLVVMTPCQFTRKELAQILADLD